MVDFFTEFFTELLDFEDLILNLSEAIGYDFSCCEIQWAFDMRGE
jgi:phage gp29-like protein